MNGDVGERPPQLSGAHACGVCAACATRSMALCAALAEDEIGALEPVMTTVQLQPNQLPAMEGDRRARVLTAKVGSIFRVH